MKDAVLIANKVFAKLEPNKNYSMKNLRRVVTEDFKIQEYNSISYVLRHITTKMTQNNDFTYIKKV